MIDIGPRVAAVIPATDEADIIATTVRAARAIPRVDLVVVVDDGSEDETQAAARAAGATVIRHSIHRGKYSAMETGASVVAMRDPAGATPRGILFLDAYLGESAIELAPLIPPILNGDADCAIAYSGKPGPKTRTARMARRAIRRLTGWQAQHPLSTLRCMTREAVDAAAPFARNWGVDVGMTLDVLLAGLTVQEIACSLPAEPADSTVHNLAEYRDMLLTISARRMRNKKLPRSRRVKHEPGDPYTMPQ